MISFDNSPFFVPASANTNDTYDLQVDINSYVTVIFVDDYDIKEPQKQYLYVGSLILISAYSFPSTARASSMAQ